MQHIPVETPERAAQETAQSLLEIVSDLSRELRPQRGAPDQFTLDSTLDRDLGLDSMGRTELLLRLERAFGVSLPDQALLAETPRDLLRAVLAASGAERPAAAAEIRYQAPGKAEVTPAHAATLLEVLDWHVQTHPQRTHIYLYEDADQAAEAYSYAALQQSAQTVATGLRDKGLQPKQTVAIMLPTGSGYFFSFFGVLLAGGVPVPIYPPVRPSQLEEHLRRHQRILNNARAAILITVPEAKALARLLQAQVKTLRHVVTVEELSTLPGEQAIQRVQTQDIAFLQYTSGSTGDPKGVVLSHANLLANIRVLGERLQVKSTDVFVSWLPLYHDMGLIGAWLGSLYHAFPLVIMSPLSFLARPARWLWAIHRHRGTLSGGPNFGYELCLRKVEDRDIEGLDLSSWRYAFNGAEPVSPDTVVRFGQRFARYGLRMEAAAPVYGLAESSVGLALPPPERGPVIDRVRRDVFMRTGQARLATEDDPNALRFTACGPPLAGHEIRIVDANGREAPERLEGRLEFKGPSATSGYFHNPEATRRLFHGEWLDSGDRAYIATGEVYITGRVKDVIIRGGRNIYPYELETALGEIAGIRKGCVAVFASVDPESENERLIVAAETRETTPEALENLRRQIQNISVDLLTIPPDDVVLVPPHAVLKTSSGKIRRTAIRELYERNALGRGAVATWWQLVRVTAVSAIPQLRRWLRRGGEVLFAGYAWTVFGILAAGVWVGVAVLPRMSWRWAVARGAGRVLGWLTGIRLIVQGLENLPQTRPCVLVANHSSYLDAFVLVTAIPRSFSYVAKRELLRHFSVRVLLQRLDTVFVERFDLQRSADEAKQVTQAVRTGRSLAFFPEGTFYRMPGLLPFRMGAFVAAVQAGVAVVPVAIRGTRSILRSGSWFPRRGTARVIVGTPIAPQGSDWQAAIELRDAAREAILRHSGEPDLESEPLPE